MSYRVKLDNFEGPLDLLLHLVEKNQLDIYNIPIARVTEQYLEYLRSMEYMDLELAGEFLIMAATLLDIKARMLLPSPAPCPTEGEAPLEEPDPRRELVQRLMEYRQFKAAATHLRSLEDQQRQRFPTSPYQPPASASLPEGITVSQLIEAFRLVLDRVQEPAPRVLPRYRITLRAMIRRLLEVVYRHPVGISFFRLFPVHPGRLEVVVTFLALLELLRRHRVRAVQEVPFGDIIIHPAREVKKTCNSS